MQIEWADAKRDIKRRVSVPYAMRSIVRWRKRLRNRFDCGLCHGGGIGPVSFNEREWYCHHCHQGGDVIRLIELAHNCDFMTALKFLAEEGQVELPNAKRLSKEEWLRQRREREERQRREAEIDQACEFWTQQERVLRFACRSQIHKCDAALCKPEPWSEQDWLRAKAAFLLRESLLVEYSLLCVGSMEQRLFYIVGDAQQRSAILEEIRRAGAVVNGKGAVVDGTGRWMEVWQ